MAEKMNERENSAAVGGPPPAYNGVVANNGGIAPYSANGGVVNGSMVAQYGVNGMVTNVPLPPGQVMTMSTMSQQGPSLGRTVTGYDGERWMAPLEQSMAPANCPPGLEYLTMIDQLMIKQRTEVLEVLCSCETNNKYKVLNVLGQVGFIIFYLKL